MGFDANFLEVMEQTFHWFQFTGKDPYGNPTYTDMGDRHPCVAFPMSERRGTGSSQTATSGPEKIRTYEIYCQPLGVAPRDKLTVSDSKGNTSDTFVESADTWYDPVLGDPGLQQLITVEMR